MQYEYKVVPTPAPPRKTPGIKGAEAKFAYGLEVAMNTYGADGWEYLRADILPSEERRGLRSTQTVYRTVLVFRRAVVDVPTHLDDSDAAAEARFAAPQPQPEPQTEYQTHSYQEPEPQYAPQPAPQPDPEPTYEEAREAERGARFSLVAPARRGDDTGAPPLSAPRVHGEDAGGTDDRR
ncbi:MAG: DUF4177 domain-containing protein [Pseudomonadota bacterium]